MHGLAKTVLIKRNIVFIKEIRKMCWLSYDNRTDCLEDFFLSNHWLKVYNFTRHRAACTLHSYGQQS